MIINDYFGLAKISIYIYNYSLELVRITIL